jgi:lipopolysaccharide transport system ATP-binding protein
MTVTELALRIDGLGKTFRIGGRHEPYRTLRDSLRDVVVGPFRRLRERAEPDREFWALRDVSFDVRRGEVVGIIGRNGAGKSTLLKILSRITEPTLGRVGIRGRVGSLLEVGTGFHPELTGRENVFLNGAILGMKRTEIAAKFDEIVAFAELDEFLDTPVKHYSSGMYTRLAFSVAAHLEPDILIVDEVLAVGDAQFQAKCLGKMGDVASEGRTVLFVSHNMHVVQKLCSRAIWIDGGHIRKDGSAAEVVRGYLGSMSGTGALAEKRADSETAAKAAYFDSWHVDGDEPHASPVGKNLTLVFDVAVRTRTRGVVFGLAVWSEDETLIWAAVSHENLTTYDLDPGKYALRFDLGRMPLVGGRYSLEVSINSPQEQLDRWHVSPSLNLIPTKTTRVPPEWQGVIDWDCRIDLARETSS